MRVTIYEARQDRGLAIVYELDARVSGNEFIAWAHRVDAVSIDQDCTISERIARDWEDVVSGEDLHFRACSLR
jgi:hypothetical protein